MSRLEQLLKFLEEDPDDPFNIYALALEYQKLDPEKALVLFNLLLEEHANYVPTYYHLGKLYEETGERDKAITVFEKGVEKARIQNEFKALRELRSALDELIFE